MLFWSRSCRLQERLAQLARRDAPLFLTSRSQPVSKERLELSLFSSEIGAVILLLLFELGAGQQPLGRLAIGLPSQCFLRFLDSFANLFLLEELLTGLHGLGVAKILTRGLDASFVLQLARESSRLAEQRQLKPPNRRCGQFASHPQSICRSQSSAGCVGRTPRADSVSPRAFELEGRRVVGLSTQGPGNLLERSLGIRFVEKGFGGANGVGVLALNHG